MRISLKKARARYDLLSTQEAAMYLDVSTRTFTTNYAPRIERAHKIYKAGKGGRYKFWPLEVVEEQRIRKANSPKARAYDPETMAPPGSRKSDGSSEQPELGGLLEKMYAAGLVTFTLSNGLMVTITKEEK